MTPNVVNLRFNLSRRNIYKVSENNTVNFAKQTNE